MSVLFSHKAWAKADNSAWLTLVSDKESSLRVVLRRRASAISALPIGMCRKESCVSEFLSRRVGSVPWTQRIHVEDEKLFDSGVFTDGVGEVDHFLITAHYQGKRCEGRVIFL